MYAPPAVAGELLLVGSCAGQFMALDRHSGRVEWAYDIHQDGAQTSFHGAPLLADGLVITATDNGFRSSGCGHVYAFEQATGRLCWKYRRDVGISSDVVPVGENVCVVTQTDELIALNRASGQLAWEFATGVEDPKSGAVRSLAQLGDRVFFAGQDKTLYALDGRTGEVGWRRTFDATLTCAPVAARACVYVGTDQPSMCRLDSRHGEITATLALPAAPRRVPVYTPERLLVFLGDRTVAALDLNLTRVAWSHTGAAARHQSRPLVWQDFVVVGDAAARVLALSLADGAPYWMRTFADEDIRSIGGWEETLYIGTLRGTLLAWRPEL